MLAGKLVCLRPLDMSDLEDYVRWFNDHEVTRFLASRYFMTRLAEEEWLRARTTRPDWSSNLFLAMDTRAEGRHIGSVGLHDISPEERKATFGIAVGEKDCWDRGYGTDATLTILRFGFEEMNLNRVMLHVDERNARAIACYRKCGFVEEGRMRQDRYAEGRYWDTLIMGILRPEWEALHGRIGREA